MRQYMFNLQDLNPAHAGNTGLLQVMAFARHQWVSFGKGSPQAYFLNFDVPFAYVQTMTPGRKMQYSHGLGLHVNRDAIGFGTRYTAEISYAARFHMRSLGHLAFGLGIKAVNDQFKAEWRSTDAPENDPAIPSPSQSSVVFDLSFGLYYVNNGLYLSLSGQNLLGTKIRKQLSPTPGATKGLLGSARSIILASGYDIPVHANWSMQPAVLVASDFATYQIGLSLNTTYNQMLWFGVNYYVLESAGAMIGVNLFNGLRIGYSFDYPLLKGFNISNAGSHEVMLGYAFSLVKVKTPREYKSIRYL